MLAQETFVIFYLREALYALPVRGVQEIQSYKRQDKPRLLPRKPGVFEEVIDLREEVLPVLDLGAYLGMQPFTPGRKSCYIILEHPEGEKCALLVDSVQEVASIEAADIEKASATLKRTLPQNLVLGVVRRKIRSRFNVVKPSSSGFSLARYSFQEQENTEDSLQLVALLDPGPLLHSLKGE